MARFTVWIDEPPLGSADHFVGSAEDLLGGLTLAKRTLLKEIRDFLDFLLKGPNLDVDAKSFWSPPSLPEIAVCVLNENKEVWRQTMADFLRQRLIGNVD